MNTIFRVAKKIWTFLKVVGFTIGAIFTVLILAKNKSALNLLGKIVDTISPDKEIKNWRVDSEDESRIIITDSETNEETTVALPENVKASDIEKVGISKSDNDKTIEVQIKHETENRKNTTPTNDSAFSNLYGND